MHQHPARRALDMCSADLPHDQWKVVNSTHSRRPRQCRLCFALYDICAWLFGSYTLCGVLFWLCLVVLVVWNSVFAAKQ